MKKISIISSVFENIDKLAEVGNELIEFFKDKYNFEVFYYYSGNADGKMLDDYHFNYLKITDNQNFNDCVVDGFNRASGDCVVVADLSNEDYLDYLTKLLVEWEAKAQVVLVKHQPSSSFWGKVKNFFAKVGKKIYDFLLGFVGLHADFCAFRNFQLFSKEVVEVIKSFPEKNYYLRNFDCWVDFRVSVLYSNKKVKIKNNTKTFTNDFIFGLCSLGLMTASILLVSLSSGLVAKEAFSTFVLIGVGLSICLGAFAIFCLYRWFVYKKTLLKINMK